MFNIPGLLTEAQALNCISLNSPKNIKDTVDMYKSVQLLYKTINVFVFY